MSVSENAAKSLKGRRIRKNSFAVMFSEKRLEFEDMAADRLVGWLQVFASCYGWPDKSLATQEHDIHTKNIKPTVPYGRNSVMVWDCISYDDNIDLVTIQGKLTGERYMCDVLEPVFVSQFENHLLATRHLYMDENARPHRSIVVTAYLKRNWGIALASLKPRFESAGAYLGQFWASDTENGPSYKESKTN